MRWDDLRAFCFEVVLVRDLFDFGDLVFEVLDSLLRDNEVEDDGGDAGDEDYSSREQR